MYQMKSNIRRSIAGGSVACLMFLSACATHTNIPVGEVPMAQAPTTEDLATAKSYMDQAMSEEGYQILPQKGPHYERGKKIVDRLARAAGASNFSYPVYIVDAGEDVNAATVNNNTVVIFKELLVRVPNDDELAVVLAHEIGHAVARHSDDKTTDSREQLVGIGSYILGTVAATAAAYAGAGGAADLAGNLTQTATGTIGMGALVRSYDRKLEYEADHVGLMIMAKAGYNPEAALTFWGRANEIFGENSGGSFLSTHPSSDDRLENLQKALPLAKAHYEQARVTVAQAEPAAKKGKAKAKPSSKKKAPQV